MIDPAPAPTILCVYRIRFLPGPRVVDVLHYAPVKRSAHVATLTLDMIRAGRSNAVVVAIRNKVLGFSPSKDEEEWSTHIPSPLLAEDMCPRAIIHVNVTVNTPSPP